MEIRLKPFQDQFLFSAARFPAIVAGVGTGKTLMLLLKVWNVCEQVPRATGMVVRKEYTDLRDSTIKDFTKHFHITPDSNKEVRLPNGSVIMFRHGAEVNVLKNITAHIVALEQAEEFETEEQFDHIRDRMRGMVGAQIAVIANAFGQNWIWRRWIQPADAAPLPTRGVHPRASATHHVLPGHPEYEAVTANSFANADNLPPDYVEDLLRMEEDSPQHFQQYVMNRFDVTDVADKVITGELLERSVKLSLPQVGDTRRFLGIDVARYGDNETCLSVVESRGLSCLEQVHQECFRDQSTVWTAGKASEMITAFGVDVVVVDDDGVGGGVTDQLSARNDVVVVPFRGGLPAKDPEHYKNTRTEAAFMVQGLLRKGWLKLLPDLTLHEQALSLRYRYHPDDALVLMSKEEMRHKGLRSPDRFEALMMAVYGTSELGRRSAAPSWELEAALATIPENGGISFRP